MSSGQRVPPESPAVESGAVEQQARLGLEPQGVQEQQSIEDASIPEGQEQQNVEDSSILGVQEQQNIQAAGLGPASGAMQPTQVVGSGHNSGQQQPSMEDVVRWQRRGELPPFTEMLSQLLRRFNIRPAVLLEHLRRESQAPTQADNGIQARTGNNHQIPHGRPQQGRARRRMPDQQTQDDHPQQGTARRRMRLQVSSLHLDTDYKESVLGLERSDASRSCNALNPRSLEVKQGGVETQCELKDVSIASTEGPEGSRTYGRMPLDPETGKWKGYIKGLQSAESNYSTLSGSFLSSTSTSMPSLAALMILLLGLIGAYLHLQLSRPL